MKFTTLLFITAANLSLFVGTAHSEPAELEIDETVVKDVLTFLQNNEFEYELEGSERKVYGSMVVETDYEQSSEYSFSYDASSAILKIACRKKNFSASRNVASASLTVSVYEVQCSTFGPSFTIGKFDEFLLAELDNEDDFRTISFKVQGRYKYISDYESWTTETASYPRGQAVAKLMLPDWEEMENQLEKEESDPSKERKVEISLDKEMAPRLKAALEDFAKAHGASISKY